MNDAPHISYVMVPTSGPIFDGAIEAAIKALGLPNFFVSMDTAKVDATKAIAAALDYVKSHQDSGIVAGTQVPPGAIG